MKKRKQVKLVRNLVCLMMCIILMGGSIPVKATESEPELEFVEASFSRPIALGGASARGIHFVAGYNGFRNMTGGRVAVGGSTTATGKKDSVYISMTLERFQGGTWRAVQGWTTRTSNTHIAIVDEIYTVATGYNYRVVSTHSVTHGGVTESGLIIGGSLMIY
jgi:hypothetical protein